MSDDFGTVNLRRGERSREIEILRGHYRRHREALVAMIEDSPTEHLALEYQKIVTELDRSLSKLDELEGVAPAARAPEPPRHPARPSVAAPAAASMAATSPGMRPLHGASDDARLGGIDGALESDYDTHPPNIPAAREIPRSRLALIAAVAIVALVAIGWLIWKASSDRSAGDGAVVQELTTADAETIAPETVAPPPLLSAMPPAQDFGIVSKGARAARQFEIRNDTEEPMTIQVARSECRCLYYEHAPVIPPKTTETLTVTIDGSKAPEGELSEAVRVSAKADPNVATTIDITATVR